MATFFSEVLDGFLSPVFLEKVHKKFHFSETHMAALEKVAKEMLPLMHRDAFWESKEFLMENPRRHSAFYERVVMSLGEGIDDLQEQYTGEGLLLQSYMLEALASELLLRGYDAYNGYIRENTKLHVARYHFPGSEEAFPIEALPDLLEAVTPRVTCNSAFCMLPKKSVAFLAELTEDAKVQCQGVCIGCGNKTCPNRIEDDCEIRKRIAAMTDMPLPYGYSRIFHTAS